jgi:hypothetical protein
MTSVNRFENLKHLTHTGEYISLPLYLDEVEGLTNKSKVLLHIAKIIGDNVDDFDNGIQEIAERINEIATGEVYEPEDAILISDQYSTNSVTIDGLNTHVSVNGVGVFDVDTAAVADMLNIWAENSSK